MTKYLADESYIRETLLENGFWFVDIPRTSSSSIRVELGRRFGHVYGKSNIVEKEHATEQVVPDHVPAVEIARLLGPGDWDSLFTFTIIRNPWERVFSMYCYRKKLGNRIPGQWSFRDYVLALDQATPGTRYFTYHAHRYGMSEFLLDDAGDVMVKRIIRFEDRDGALREIGERLGCGDLGTLSIQAAAPADRRYPEFYDNETKSIIERRYARDIELFGYGFGEQA